MDDVTFGRSGPYGASGVATPGRSLMSMNAFCCRPRCHVHKCINDTVLLRWQKHCLDPHTRPYASIIQTSAEQLEAWTANNRMVININKTKEMLFGPFSKSNPDELFIGQVKVERVTDFISLRWHRPTNISALHVRRGDLNKKSSERFWTTLTILCSIYYHHHPWRCHYGTTPISPPASCSEHTYLQVGLYRSFRHHGLTHYQPKLKN